MRIFAEKVCQFKKTLYLCIAFLKKGRLAQLVQSICLTSRGSAVRIRQRPHNKPKRWLSFENIVIIRAFSSAGSEHLPYKQRVGGSNPSTPTPKTSTFPTLRFFYLCYNCPSCHDWVKIGAALSSLGESGRHWFHICSSQNGGYNAIECDRKFDNLLCSNRRIGIGTFFHYCKNAGLEF